MMPKFQLSATLLSSQPLQSSCPLPLLSPGAVTIPFHPALAWSTTEELGAWLLNTFNELLACCGLQHVESTWRWTAKIVVCRGDTPTTIAAPGAFMEAFRRYSDRSETQRWLNVVLIGPPTVDGTAQYASFRVHTPSGSAAF
jgi:hypothetical protein